MISDTNAAQARSRATDEVVLSLEDTAGASTEFLGVTLERLDDLGELLDRTGEWNVQNRRKVHGVADVAIGDAKDRLLPDGRVERPCAVHRDDDVAERDRCRRVGLEDDGVGSAEYGGVIDVLLHPTN